MGSSIIAIDIGNTNVSIGFGEREAAGWTRIVYFHPDPDRTEAEWVSLLFPHLPLIADTESSTAVICCSVVPRVTPSLLAAINSLLDAEPVLITSATPLSIDIGTETPGQTGADRLVNANTAFLLHGGPAIIIDTGTATKIDAITADGVFLGGAIAPGLGLGMDALASRAAQLSAVPLFVPSAAIGRGTISAVQSGVLLGHVAMIEGMVSRIREELGSCEAILLTGGYHELLRDHLPAVTHVAPALTLDGLRMLVG